MNWEQIKEIIIAFATSSIGATLIAVITKFIVDYFKNKVTAKATKLNSTDKSEIAEGVINALTGKITIDIEDEINKATRSLIGEFRTALNNLINQNNDLKKVITAQAKVISQFKTVQGTSALDELNSVMSTVNTDLTPTTSVETVYEVKTVATTTDNKALTGKVSY